MQRPFKPSSGLPRGPEHLWMQMRLQSPQGFTMRSLRQASNGVRLRTLKSYVGYCAKIGLIERIGELPAVGCTVAFVWRCVKGAPLVAPVLRRDSYTGTRGRIQENLWSAMRKLPSFTIRELAFAASTDEHPVKPRTAENYVRELTAAGALIVITPYRKGAPGRAGAREGKWRLKPRSNTGPAPLRVMGDRVFDPNTRQWLGAPREASS